MKGNFAILCHADNIFNQLIYLKLITLINMLNCRFQFHLVSFLCVTLKSRNITYYSHWINVSSFAIFPFAAIHRNVTPRTAWDNFLLNQGFSTFLQSSPPSYCRQYCSLHIYMGDWGAKRGNKERSEPLYEIRGCLPPQKMFWSLHTKLSIYNTSIYLIS